MKIQALKKSDGSFNSDARASSTTQTHTMSSIEKRFIKLVPTKKYLNY